MATDIAKLQLGTQDLINKAVQTITETQKTQKYFDENLKLTEKKIGIHNEDTESHPDIRSRLEDMPSMITDPVISGPHATETGEENIWTFSATGVIPTVSVTKFIVTDNHGETFEVEADTNGFATFKHAFTGNRNEQTSFKVKAMGTYNYISKEMEYDILITQHLPPVFSGLTYTIPAIITYGKSYKWKIEGITDPDDDLTEIDVEVDNPKVTLSQTTNIVQGLEYDMTVANDLFGPGTVTFKITAKDGRGLSTVHNVTMTVNSKPNVSTLTHNLPNNLCANSNVPARIAGVTDNENNALTFSITSSLGAISFSKTEGIAINEEFTVYVGQVDYATPYTLTLVFTDEYGAQETATITSAINTPPSTTNMVVTQNRRHYINETSVMTFTGATDAEGGTVRYEIENTHPELSFSKVGNIEDGEPINVEVLSTAVDGSVYPITVYAVDESNAKTPMTVNIIINAKPVVDNITCSLRPYVTPDTSYTATLVGATDPDGDEVTYTVTSSNPNITVENAENIKDNVEFILNVPTEDVVPRGTEFNLIVVASDGKVTNTKLLPYKVNKLVTGLMQPDTIPGVIYGGEENAIEMLWPTLADEDIDQDITFEVDTEDENVIIMTPSVANGEKIKFYTKKVAEDTLASFRVRSYDTYEYAQTETFEFTISPIIVTKKPEVLYPTEGEMYASYEGWTMQLDEYAAVPWLGDGVYPSAPITELEETIE